MLFTLTARSTLKEFLISLVCICKPCLWVKFAVYPPWLVTMLAVISSTHSRFSQICGSAFLRRCRGSLLWNYLWESPVKSCWKVSRGSLAVCSYAVVASAPIASKPHSTWELFNANLHLQSRDFFLSWFFPILVGCKDLHLVSSIHDSLLFWFVIHVEKFSSCFVLVLFLVYYSFIDLWIFLRLVTYFIDGELSIVRGWSLYYWLRCYISAVSLKILLFKSSKNILRIFSAYFFSLGNSQEYARMEVVNCTIASYSMFLPTVTDSG